MGIRNIGGQNLKWLPQPGMPSRGPTSGRKCYVTPELSEGPNTKSGVQYQKLTPTKGNKIWSGCLTPAFSGGQKRAEMLCHP